MIEFLLFFALGYLAFIALSYWIGGKSNDN
jgi:hypothetical protein